MDDKRNSAARVIQRYLRNYQKELKTLGENSNIEIKIAKSEPKLPQNFNNAYSSTHLAERQAEINEILAKLKIFYEKIPESEKSIKYLDLLMDDVFKSLENLGKITNLEDCHRLKVEAIGEEARNRHEAMLNERSEKWWETLNKD